MLVLSRRREEMIQIGANIFVKILSIGLDRVRLGIIAPASLPIVRPDAAAGPIDNVSVTEILD